MMTAPTVEYPTEPCRSCAQPIIWCVTQNGYDMPVDPQPHPTGNIVLEQRGGGLKPVATVLNSKDRAGRMGTHRSHFATCPQAAEWRRRRPS